MRIQAARQKGKSFRKKKIHIKIEGSWKLRKVKSTFKVGGPMRVKEKLLDLHMKEDLKEIMMWCLQGGSRVDH